MRITNRPSSLKRRLLVSGLAVMAGAIYAVRSPIVQAGPATTPEKPTEQKSRSGADLYATHCNRCHPERYPTEFNSNQWKTLMTHMRVRANLSAQDAREVLKYLQQDSGQ